MNELTTTFYGRIVPEFVSEFFEDTDKAVCYECSDCGVALNSAENLRPCWNCNYDEAFRTKWERNEKGEII